MFVTMIYIFQGQICRQCLNTASDIRRGAKANLEANPYQLMLMSCPKINKGMCIAYYEAHPEPAEAMLICIFCTVRAWRLTGTVSMTNEDQRSKFEVMSYIFN